MVREHAPCQHAHRQPRPGFGDHFLEGLEIPFLAENPHPPHGAVQHVVRVSSAGNTQPSWHDPKTSIFRPSCQEQRLSR